jgi:anti-sigma factor RsiW
MQTPERPCGGDIPDDGAPSYEWLDEWLCEYVDGTMDPSVEAVFEQYVEANPELKAHVQRLRQTRELLCGCDAPDDPLPDPPVDRPQTSDDDSLLQDAASPLPTQACKQPAKTAGIVSSIAVALAVGFLAGSVLVDPATFSPAPTVSTVEGRPSAQESVREEAPPVQFEQATPRLRSRASSFSANESLISRPATVPAAGSDTVRSRSPISTLGE